MSSLIPAIIKNTIMTVCAPVNDLIYLSRMPEIFLKGVLVSADGVAGEVVPSPPAPGKQKLFKLLLAHHFYS